MPFCVLAGLTQFLFFIATVRKHDPLLRKSLSEFGQYVAECMPKYVQQVQLTATDELEVLIAPSGIIPVISFLKDHHNAQFLNLTDIAAVDVPTRAHRFEVILFILPAYFCHSF